MWWSRWMGAMRRRGRHIPGETLSEYLDERLSRQALQSVERHLEECRACRRELASLQATVMLLQRVPPEAVPRSFALRLAPEAARRPPYLGYSLFALRGATAAATLLLAVMLVLDLSAVSSGPQTAPALKMTASEERSRIEAPQSASQPALPSPAAPEAASSDQQRVQERAGGAAQEERPAAAPGLPVQGTGALPAWQRWLTVFSAVVSVAGWISLVMVRRWRRKGGGS